MSSTQPVPPCAQCAQPLTLAALSADVRDDPAGYVGVCHDCIIAALKAYGWLPASYSSPPPPPASR